MRDGANAASPMLCRFPSCIETGDDALCGCACKLLLLLVSLSLSLFCVVPSNHQETPSTTMTMVTRSSRAVPLPFPSLASRFLRPGCEREPEP